MLNRRAFAGTIVALSLIDPILHAEEGIVGKLKSGLDWFIGIVKETPRLLENIYDWLLRTKAGYRILSNSRDALNDIRRKLSDPSAEKELQSKLRTWLKHYDAIAKEAPRSGEARPLFVARQQREFEALKTEWESLKKDAVLALHDIGRLQDEIESVDPGTLNSDEYRLFRSLLQQKKGEEEFLSTEFPTEPYVIDRLRETANKLDETIGVIARNAPALDQAIKKAG